MSILYIVAHAALTTMLTGGGTISEVAETSSAAIHFTQLSADVTSQEALFIQPDTLLEVSLPEFEGADIKVYEADEYTIYSIGKDLLFSTGSAGLKTGAEQSLKKVSSAITKRNKDGQMKIYAYIDASENPNFNRDVAERRAQAISNWLQENGSMGGDHIVVQPVIEIPAEASTASKRQKGGRFEIIVRKTAS